MDKVDREIAKIMPHNARVPLNYIAKKLNKSTSYIISRYDKLRESRLFAGSSIRVNLKKLGYPANAMVYVTTSIGTKISDVHRCILKVPNVIILVKIIGDCDLMAVVPLRSFKDLFELEKRFRAIEGIEKIQINVNPPFVAYPVSFFTPLF